MVLLALNPAASVGLTRFEYSEVAMGGRARIVVYGPSRACAETACRAAFQRIARLEEIMSDYRPASELSRLSARSGGPAVRVSTELLDILERSQELARRSGGAFDVTVGPVVKLWREARKSRRLPAREEIDAAVRLVGWRRVIIDQKSRTVRLELGGMRLDLGGIAKGYACDEAQRVLRRHEIRRALVQMGGDIAVGGPPPGARGWRIEVANAGPAQRWVHLSNAAVSSSGDTEQYVEIGGKRYSHVVDPRTGIGLTSRMEVTVISPEAATSDGLATAVSVLGAKKGRALVRTYAGARVYVRRVGG